MKVGVIDYGLGNLHSVCKALASVQAEPVLVTGPAGLADCGRLVLPGVGAFADGMAGLERSGLASAVRAAAAGGVPLAGICLGMQLLFDESEEFGVHPGLGIIPGRVVRIPSTGVKVPHVGWNRLSPAPGAAWEGTPLEGTAPGTFAYFVHSFHALPADGADLLATTVHGPHRLTAAVRHARVVGFQFHPEKSGQAGLAMLRAFCSAPADRPR